MSTDSITQSLEISNLKNDIYKHSYLIDSLIKKKKVLIHLMLCTTILLILSIISKYVLFIIILIPVLFFEFRFYNKTISKIVVYNAIKSFLQFALKREQTGDQSLPPFLN